MTDSLLTLIHGHVDRAIQSIGYDWEWVVAITLTIALIIVVLVGVWIYRFWKSTK